MMSKKSLKKYEVKNYNTETNETEKYKYSPGMMEQMKKPEKNNHKIYLKFQKLKINQSLRSIQCRRYR